MSDDPDFDAFPADLEKLEKEDERRSERRVPAAIFVEVSGFDRRGRFFTEHTVTTNVSVHGCCFRLRQDIAFDALLAIQPVAPPPESTGEPVLYQIAWAEPIGKGSIVGATRLHGQTSWCVAFPATEEKRGTKA
jgi:hypothetical protein